LFKQRVLYELGLDWNFTIINLIEYMGYIYFIG